MDISIQEVLRCYKEELAACKEEAILRKVAMIQLEEENEDLKQQLAELAKQIEVMRGSEQ